MLERCLAARRGRVFPISALLALSAALNLSAVLPALAQDAPLPPVTLGAGVRTSFSHTAPDEEESSDEFTLNSARLYVTGSVTSKIKLMVNTEYNGGTNDIGVLDAVARMEFSDRMNIWVGRFLPPSDRSNLYGPYYSQHWSVYSDGVQDGYPFVFQGRDNGAMYWGQFNKVKVSAGAFDGSSSTGDDTVIGAGRVQVDFWDAEPGYYLNGTFYGDKNILAIGGAAQVQGSDKSAYSFDFLLEKKVAGGGAFSVEAEWARYDRLGGYDSHYGTDDGGYVLGSYLFPAGSGPGRFQVLGKFGEARFREGLSSSDFDYNQKTTEFNLNYVLKQFNARAMFFFKDTRFDAVRSDFVQVGIGLQFQM